MNPITEIRILFNRRDDVRMKITRERRRKLDARQARRGDSTQQTTEWRCASESLEAVFNARPVAIHVLADKMNFLVTKCLQPFRFDDDLACPTTAFAST